MAFAIVRLRSSINVRETVRRTMKMLHLTRVNHCSVVQESPQNSGMLKKAKDFITWGEIDASTLEDLIRERGRLEGGTSVTDSYVDEKTDYDSIASFSAAIIEGKVRYKDLEGVKPLFRLHPPKGGLESIKHHHSIGGSLGYRGEEINSFVRRML